MLLLMLMMRMMRMRMMRMMRMMTNRHLAYPMMRDPKTEPIPAPDPATPTVAAPGNKYYFQV